GPATAIRSIAAGKIAAANIDEYLGYNHEISVDVEVPHAKQGNRPPMGRIQMRERPSASRRKDFEEIEEGMTLEEAMQEASRCLRCDHFGMGSFKGGREQKW
nr:glutamate synthase [Bacillota bacterium]